MTRNELMAELYARFMAGLYVKFHLSYIRSKLFIKFGQSCNEEAEFESLVIAKVDSENVLKDITNKNMAKAFCLIAQGYYQWEVAEMLKRSISTIEWYVREIKKYLINN